MKSKKKGIKNVPNVSTCVTKSKQTPTKALMAMVQKELKLATEAKQKE